VLLEHIRRSYKEGRSQGSPYFIFVSGRWMKFGANREMSDGHAYEAQFTSVNFKLAHPPGLPAVLSAFTMPAHLSLLQYRTHNLSTRKSKRQGITPTLEP
jgi:hypothetical protein